MRSVCDNVRMEGKMHREEIGEVLCWFKMGFRMGVLTLGDVQLSWEGISVCALMFPLALCNYMVRR